MPFYSHRTPQRLQFRKELRKQMTKEERKLWFECLRDYPVRFRSQEIILDYIADFYCSRAKLIVELDGEQHADPVEKERDALRTRRIEQLGYKVIRIPNREIWRNFQGVKEYIYREMKKRLKM
ncbi:MAG: endonuclease domain-containing protein [Acidaminococcus sp.]|uniref:endonuclease domain-containing protein n=1 Tax=Acidaminococcus sp. TaxID=1872103 RepID=UPI0026E09416|nr:endonuclease domain-containing protein [Acidaminococcus sp.]MDO5598053.1 endonuclease domain-containing protein [Acidaminococcus sp.]